MVLTSFSHRHGRAIRVHLLTARPSGQLPATIIPSPQCFPAAPRSRSCLAYHLHLVATSASSTLVLVTTRSDAPAELYRAVAGRSQAGSVERLSSIVPHSSLAHLNGFVRWKKSKLTSVRCPSAERLGTTVLHFFSAQPRSPDMCFRWSKVRTKMLKAAGCPSAALRKGRSAFRKSNQRREGYG